MVFAIHLVGFADFFRLDFVFIFPKLLSHSVEIERFVRKLQLLAIFSKRPVQLQNLLPTWTVHNRQCKFLTFDRLIKFKRQLRQTLHQEHACRSLCIVCCSLLRILAVRERRKRAGKSAVKFCRKMEEVTSLSRNLQQVNSILNLAKLSEADVKKESHVLHFIPQIFDQKEVKLLEVSKETLDYLKSGER